MYEKEGTLSKSAPSDAKTGDQIPEACAQPLPEGVECLSDGKCAEESPSPLEAPPDANGTAGTREDRSADPFYQGADAEKEGADAEVENDPTEDETPVGKAEGAPADDETPMEKGGEDPSASDESDAEAMEAPALFADPLPHSDPDPGASPAEDPTSRLDAMRGELNRLEKRLQMQEERFASLGKECEEFGALYPDVPLSSLSEGVWKATRDGVPLAAAYALEERRRIRAEEKARESNLQNRMRSAGELRSAENSFFSPAEVRAMSPAEVRANYQSIMQSMQKWH